MTGAAQVCSVLTTYTLLKTRIPCTVIEDCEGRQAVTIYYRLSYMPSRMPGILGQAAMRRVNSTDLVLHIS